MGAIAGLIIAGGKNLRMNGQDKAFLAIDGEQLIDRTVNILKSTCREVFVVTNSPLSYLNFDCHIVADIYPNKGPLGGIYTGLLYSSLEKAIVVACDMPFLDRDFICYMKSIADAHDIVVPKVAGKYQPLHAIYSKACLPRIKQLLLADRLKVTNFYRSYKILSISEEQASKFGNPQMMFANVNSPMEVEAARGEHNANSDFPPPQE